MNYKVRKRCVALLLAAMILGALAAPALAADQPVTSTGTFWQALAAESPDFVGNVIGVFDKGTCTVSEDRRHHGKVIRKADPVFGEPGAWLALCDHCGEQFKVYDDDMQRAYDSHVGDIQTEYGTTFIDSNGLSRFYPTGWSYRGPSALSISGLSVAYPCFDVLFLDRGGVLLCDSAPFSLPTGLYTLVLPPAVACTGYDINPQICAARYFEVGTTSGPSVYFTPPSGGQLSFTNDGSIERFLRIQFQTWALDGYPLFHYEFAPYIEGVPLIPSGSSVVSVDTRVGSIFGDYGIIGDNGTIIKSDIQYIVNETTNTYTNPATGSTAPVTNWTYDYGDRSYTLTLDTGETVTVTYGDENVTINQGGDTYNVYYIVQGGGEVEPTPPPTEPPTPTETVSPTDPPGPTEPVDPDAPPDTTGWGILDFLKGIFDFLWGLGEKLMNLLKNLLMALFMPKEESIKELEDKVAEKLPFISDLQDFGDQFSDVLNNPAKTARSMKWTTVVNVGNKAGGVSYGDAQANMLDMTWYLDYKPMVDDIIEGVAWLVFLWNLYGALPAIIHGGASGLHTTAGLVKWKEEHDDVG